MTPLILADLLVEQLLAIRYPTNEWLRALATQPNFHERRDGLALPIHVSEGNLKRAQLVNIRHRAVHLCTRKLTLSLNHLLLRAPAHSNLVDFVVCEVHECVLLEQTIVVPDGQSLLPATSEVTTE